MNGIELLSRTSPRRLPGGLSKCIRIHQESTEERDFSSQPDKLILNREASGWPVTRDCMSHFPEVDFPALIRCIGDLAECSYPLPMLSILSGR
jgi:hypothetical protein